MLRTRLKRPAQNSRGGFSVALMAGNPQQVQTSGPARCSVCVQKPRLCFAYLSVRISPPHGRFKMAPVTVLLRTAEEWLRLQDDHMISFPYL